MLSSKKVVAKAPAPKKAAPGPAPAHPKSDPKKPAPKVAAKPAPKATKPAPKATKPTPKATKPAAIKPAAVKPMKSIKTSFKQQKARQIHRKKVAKNVEKSTKKPAKKGKAKEIDAKPHPKKNLKKALKGKSNGGKVGNNLDYSKLVVDSLHKYHELVKAEKKKDTKKINTLKAWIKKNTHMHLKKFMDRFKNGAKKIKIEVLTKGASQSKHSSPKELRDKLDKDDDMDDELHKFKKGEAKGRVMPKQIRETLKKIKGGKVTDTKIGHIGGYHYLFVYVRQDSP